MIQFENLNQASEYLVYIAQPYSKDPLGSMEQAVIAARKLIELGFRSYFSPVMNSHFVEQGFRKVGPHFQPHAKWLEIDIAMINSLPPSNTIMVFLEGWEQSKGCNMEWKAAREMNIDRFSYPDLINGKITRCKIKGEHYSFVEGY